MSKSTIWQNPLELAWQRLCNSECTVRAAWLIYEEMEDAFPEDMLEALTVLEDYLKEIPKRSVEVEKLMADIRAEKAHYEEQAAVLTALFADNPPHC